MGGVEAGAGVAGNGWALLLHLLVSEPQQRTESRAPYMYMVHKYIPLHNQHVITPSRTLFTHYIYYIHTLLPLPIHSCYQLMTPTHPLEGLSVGRCELRQEIRHPPLG